MSRIFSSACSNRYSTFPDFRAADKEMDEKDDPDLRAGLSIRQFSWNAPARFRLTSAVVPRRARAGFFRLSAFC